jgi:hypothetical protein
VADTDEELPMLFVDPIRLAALRRVAIGELVRVGVRVRP